MAVRVSRDAFHLAIPADDLDAARDFYGGVLGCRPGRSAEGWVDFDFFGHQLSVHLSAARDAGTNEVDGDDVPVRHFGIVLERGDWDALCARLREAGVTFDIGPRVRFEGAPGEQGTFFIRDPAGNALEFKTFRDPEGLFT